MKVVSLPVPGFFIPISLVLIVLIFKFILHKEKKGEEGKRIKPTSSTLHEIITFYYIRWKALHIFSVNF